VSPKTSSAAAPGAGLTARRPRLMTTLLATLLASSLAASPAVAQAPAAAGQTQGAAGQTQGAASQAQGATGQAQGAASQAQGATGQAQGAAGSGLATGAARPGATEGPAWAYPWDPDFKPVADDGVPRHVPDSSAGYTLTQERDLFVAPDWHPADHPAMPDVVAHGRKPDVRACGACHRVEGTGGPESSSLAGLPAEYIVQQMADFKSGDRRSFRPDRSPAILMTAVATGATAAEVAQAAAYFSALKPRRTIKVVEAETAPRTYVARVFLAKLPEGGSEPLGGRIVEVPDDTAQFEHRDSRATFTAYVPAGSIARGEALVNTGGGGVTVPCATCHGPELRGLGSIPGIAGRSPSYIVRQLFELKQGTRAGAASDLMKPAVQGLSIDQMTSIAAYLASLAP